MNFSNMEHKGTDPHDSPLKKDIDKIRNPLLISHLFYEEWLKSSSAICFEHGDNRR